MNMEKRTGFAPINGAQIYYELSGAGQPPLVLLHSGLADGRFWQAQVPTLAAHYQVVCYDMRGYGRSEPVAGRFSHHEDCLALLDYLELETAAVIGCSKGGGIALDFALAYPERTAALGVVNSAPHGFDPGDSLEIPPLWDVCVAAFKAGDLEKAAALEVEIWVDGPRRAPGSVPAAIRDLVYEMDLQALQHEVKELGESTILQPKAATRLHEISVPTLLITGMLDYRDMLAAADLMAAQIPNTTQVQIDNAAHFPNMEQPDIFNQSVHNFLQQIESAADG